MLRQACLDATSWPVDLNVAVNLSSVQFRDRRLVETVQEALELTGLPGWRLELEITETVLLKDSEATLATRHRLRMLGARISMDDLGTGYSSMSYLRRFPFDKIKIDQSFVRDLPDNVESSAIVRAVIGLSNRLGMSVIAEGVENEAQAGRRISLACWNASARCRRWLNGADPSRCEPDRRHCCVSQAQLGTLADPRQPHMI